jgi:hypothetical protein
VGPGTADARTTAHPYQAGPGDDKVEVQDHVSGHAASPAAMMVERFHVLEPYGVDRAPLTHTVFVRLAVRGGQRSARYNAASRRTHHAEPRRGGGVAARPAS